MKPTKISNLTVLLLATLGLSSPAIAQTCVESPEGLMAWWPGDGNASDVGARLDASVKNAVDFAPGLVGDAFRLDGLNGLRDARVEMPRLAADGLADLTVEFWVNTTDTVGGLFSAANGNFSGGNELVLLQGNAGLAVWVKQARSSPDIAISISDGAWHHVAFVREGDIGRLYVDGAFVDSRTFPVGPLDVGPRGLMIGQEQDCLAGCFQPEQALDGLVDEAAIYGRALSDAEISLIFDAGAMGKCKPAVVPEPTPTGGGVAVERVDALENEIDMMLDRLAELTLQLETIDSTSHEHGAPESKSWRRRRHEHSDDDDKDRRHRHRWGRHGRR